MACETSQAGFVLTPEKGGRLEKRDVSFQEVKALKQIKNIKPTHTARNILIGAGIAVVVLGGLFSAAAASGGIMP